MRVKGSEAPHIQQACCAASFFFLCSLELQMLVFDSQEHYTLGFFQAVIDFEDTKRSVGSVFLIL